MEFLGFEAISSVNIKNERERVSQNGYRIQLRVEEACKKLPLCIERKEIKDADGAGRSGSGRSREAQK